MLVPHASEFGDIFFKILGAHADSNMHLRPTAVLFTEIERASCPVPTSYVVRVVLANEHSDRPSGEVSALIVTVICDMSTNHFINVFICLLML